MAVGPILTGPKGHRAFCEQNLSECTVTPDPGPLAMTPELWSTVWRINRSVNASIDGKTDMEIFGIEEVWTYPDTVGDCEDYALLKRRQLSAAGVPLSNLLLTMVLMKDGAAHLVLTLRTAGGDYVLDNLDNSVRPWMSTPYEYLRRQSSENAGKWVSIENGAPARWAENATAAAN